MAKKRTTLSVHCNPWHALDHEGRPAGRFPKERSRETVLHQGYVAVECVASAPEKLPPGHQGTPHQDTCWHFSREAVEVPATKYYLDALKHREILPADEKTAKLALGPLATFRPLDIVLEEEKLAAYAKWHACFNEHPEFVEPFARPKPNGTDAPIDVAEKAAKKIVADAKDKADAAAKAAKGPSEPDAKSAEAAASTTPTNAVPETAPVITDSVEEAK